MQVDTSQNSLFNKYCIDACAILDFWGSSSSYRRPYDVNVKKFSELWEYIAERIELGQIILPSFILRQIDGTYKQELKNWIKDIKGQCPDLDSPYPELEKIVNEFPAYTTARESMEDAQLVALAARRKLCVITSERISQGGTKIPNVCEYMLVDWKSLPEYLESEGL